MQIGDRVRRRVVGVQGVQDVEDAQVVDDPGPFPLGFQHTTGTHKRTVGSPAAM